MNRKQNKSLPFSVDRKDGRSLIAQIADGLRDAIVCGYWRPGDVLPSSRELESRLSVSRIVVKAAFAQLAKEGFTVPRPRMGTVVRDRAAKQWRGHVVLVYEKGDNTYLKTMLASVVQDALTEEGYVFSEAIVSSQKDGSCDFSRLDAALSRSVDLVMVWCHRPKIYAYLAKREIPYVVFGEKEEKPATAIGAIHFDYNLAMPDFAAVCKVVGVKEVVQVYWHQLMCDVAPAMRKIGIRVKKIKVPVDESEGRLIGVKRAGRKAFERLVANGRIALPRGRSACAAARSPQAFFIADDYLAEGALLALSYSGVRLPEDLRFATFANAGLGPDYVRPLSRMELDPFATGRTVADAIVGYLKTGSFPANITVGPKWIMGETMGEVKQ